MAGPADRAARRARPLRRSGALGDGDDPRRAGDGRPADRLRRRPAGQGGDGRRDVRACSTPCSPRPSWSTSTTTCAAAPSTSSGRAATARTRSTCRRWRPSSSPAPACRCASTAPAARRRCAARPTCSRSSAWSSSCRPTACGAASRRPGIGFCFAPAVPPGVPVRRAGPPRDRHPDGVQPARSDGQPRSGAPAGHRRRRRPVRRADAGVVAGPRLDRCVGRPRRRARRADDHRPLDRARPRPRRRRRARSRSTRSTSAWRRRPTSSSSAATRRTTPTSCGACSTASTAPTATSSCSTPPPRWSSPASPTTSRPAWPTAEAAIDSGRAAACPGGDGARCPRRPPSRDGGARPGVERQPRSRVRRPRDGPQPVRRRRRRRRRRGARAGPRRRRAAPGGHRLPPGRRAGRAVGPLADPGRPGPRVQRGDARRRARRRRRPARRRARRRWTRLGRRCWSWPSSSRVMPTTPRPRSSAGWWRRRPGGPCASRWGSSPAVLAWVPGFETSTHRSRHALGGSVAFSDAVFNVGRTALLVAALVAGDVEALRWATADRLHQDQRFAAAMPARMALAAGWRPARGAGGCRAADRRSACCAPRRTSRRWPRRCPPTGTPSS